MKVGCTLAGLLQIFHLNKGFKSHLVQDGWNVPPLTYVGTFDLHQVTLDSCCLIPGNHRTEWSKVDAFQETSQKQLDYQVTKI